jgi:hypothetical protein
MKLHMKLHVVQKKEKGPRMNTNGDRECTRLRKAYGAAGSEGEAIGEW